MSKGDRTRAAILDKAIQLASVRGLEALTMGELAARLGLSKSGLFGHFGSKENLQLQVLERTVARFSERVVAPALKEPRGEPRLRALIDRWLAWEGAEELPGGCPLQAAIFEVDDQPGPLRDRLAEAQRQWQEALAYAARQAVDAGHFRADLDVSQFVFELYGHVLSYVVSRRLLGDDVARDRIRMAVDDQIRRARGLAPSLPTP